MKQTMDITYRDIAKMFCKAMPLEGQEFGNKVTEYIESIKAMPNEAKIALKSAYIFSARVPREEREDMFQELALAVLKSQATDERLAYTVARCDWLNWWKAYKIRSHYSLDSVVDDGEGNQVSFGELLVGEVEFERKLNGDMDGERLFDSLPYWVKAIVQKRLMGIPIKGGDRQNIDKWVKSRPLVLAHYQ